MDYKKIAEEYKLQVEAWHLFYQSFTEHDTHISNARGILIEMFSEFWQAKKKNRDNPKLDATEKRINHLLEIVDKFEGINNRCQSLRQQLREENSKNFRLKTEIDSLNSELKSIKDLINETEK